MFTRALKGLCLALGIITGIQAEMNKFNLKRNCRTLTLSGVALLLAASCVFAQGRGGGAAGFHASGPAPVRSPSSGYAHGHGSSSYGSSGYGYDGHESGGREDNGSYHHHYYSPYNQYGYGYGYGQGAYPFAEYAYPYYVTPTNDSVGDPGTSQGGGEAPAAPDQSVYNELDVLHQQIDELRADQQFLAPGQPPNAGNAPTAAPVEKPTAAPVEKLPAALILVFRDGTRTEVQDYAVVGQIFWDLSNHGTRKIPLSQLDLQASIQANDARGIEFPEIKQN